jgi:hypothetical protein
MDKKARTLKRCHICGKIKPFKDYYKDKSEGVSPKDYLHNSCRECRDKVSG